MVGAHVTDAWTRLEDRNRTLYMYTVFIAGMAAPLFLFLAGLTIAMAASSRAVKVGHADAAAQARKRGLQVFALAFLFRLQSQLLGWGALINFLKVDILNVMGIAMFAAAIIWGAVANRIVRILLFAIATAAVAMTTPLVREAGVLAALPDAIEAYIRPLPGRTTFALFPWAAFLLAGAIVGELVFAAKTESQERRLQAGLLISGLAGAVVAHAVLVPAVDLSGRELLDQLADVLLHPPRFLHGDGPDRARHRSAFTRSCGGSLAVILHRRMFPAASSRTLGRSSLFVYWIHVEMAYGGLSRPLKRALPLEWSLVATVALCALLYRIVKWKDRKMAGRELTGAWRIFAPVLK